MHWLTNHETVFHPSQWLNLCFLSFLPIQMLPSLISLRLALLRLTLDHITMKFKIIASMILKFVSMIDYKLLWFFNLLLNRIERTSVNPGQCIHAEFPPIMLGKYKLLGIGISKCSVARGQVPSCQLAFWTIFLTRQRKKWNSLIMMMNSLNVSSLPRKH